MRCAAGEADVLVFAAGHDYGACVDLLIECAEAKLARAYVVVTSEHGALPVGMNYVRYAAMKAAQKMVCRTLAHSGIPCVDVSPAFVMDSGKDKRVNRDEAYWEEIRAEMRGKPPVLSDDVARAVVFAAENVGKITGTTISVSAGWRV